MLTQQTRRWLSPIVILLAALLVSSTAQAAPPAQGPRAVSVQVNWGPLPDGKAKTSNPRSHNTGKIFPEYIFWVRPVVGVWTDLYAPYEQIPFTIDLTYPNPYVSFYASTPIEHVSYITSCNHLPVEYKVRCTGNLPALNPPQQVSIYFKAWFIGTTSLLGQSSVTFQVDYSDTQSGSGSAHLVIPVATPITLNEAADSPANAATGVLIESSGQGPLLQWHDHNPVPHAYICGDGTDRANQDIAYRIGMRKQGDSTWQDIGAMPNCSRQVQLPSTALTCKANGDPQTYEWNIQAWDVKYIPNVRYQDNIFTFTTASCRPVIKEVKPEHDINPHFFLQNVSVPNKIQVVVDDWNGPAYATPVTTLPAGSKITFDLNGTVTDKAPTLQNGTWKAEHTYDMGTDLMSGHLW